MDEINLSATQADALNDICKKHVSGFLTGPGGTGKSFLISQITETMDKNNRKYALTATTGIAAVLIGGITLHSQFRIFPDDLLGDEERNIARIRNNKFLQAEIAKIATLIIDEVSMLDVILFERVHKILCYVHKCGAPFGGIQVILVGDFFQLPPVSKSLKFIFETSLFWETCDNFWELREVWRQTDPKFCNLLHRLRIGESTDDDLEILKSRLNVDLGDIEPTKLFSKNVNVDQINLHKFQKLEGEGQTFSFRDGEFRSDEKKSPEIDKFWLTSREKFRKDISVNDVISLKIGTQVMLAFNLDVSRGLCNGSRGVVVALQESKNPSNESQFHVKDKESRSIYPQGLLPVVLFDNGSKVLIPYVRWTRSLGKSGDIYYWNIPLRYAWASTIHRMQGQTLSLVDASLDSSVFEVGQAYVALSRCKSLEGLRLSSFDPSSIKVNEKVKEFYTIPFSLQKADFLMPKQKKMKAEPEESVRIPAAYSFTVIDED